MKGIFFNYKETKENLPYFKNSIKVNILPILSLWGLRAFHAGPKMGKKKIFFAEKKSSVCATQDPKIFGCNGAGSRIQYFFTEK